MSELDASTEGIGPAAPSACEASATAVAILMYHSLDTSGSVVSVTPSDFTDQMACVADMGFRGISLREAVAYRKATGTWPSRSVVVTFDDGYANFCERALPTLQRHLFTATIFVVSGYMVRQNDWGPLPVGLGNEAILSVWQARELTAAGIEIGAHTQTHADFQRLDCRQVENEILASRAELEAQVGAPVESFAYPFGRVTRAARDIVRREFRAACTTVLQRAGDDSSHELPRVDMYYIRSRRALERLLRGRLDWYLMARRWGRAIRRCGGVWDG